MYKIMKKIVIAFTFILFVQPLLGAHIQFLQKPHEFLIFNRRNSEIYKYYNLEPEMSLKIKTIDVDTLSIYSRILLNGSDTQDYSYQININNWEKDIHKTASKSAVSRGVNGENVSSYNKFKKILESKENYITIKNTSDLDIIFKITGNNIVKDNKKIDYIRYTPNFYKNTSTIVIDKKEFTYYSAKSGKISLTLQGPIYLKIVSRVIFNNTIEQSKNYRFSVFDNRDLISEFTERAHKSSSAWIKNGKDLIPSTGDVNIIFLKNGIHNIEISDSDINRDLMFRFYINKSAVEIIEQ